MTLRNLNKLHKLDYSDSNLCNLSCDPELLKEHFKKSTIDELMHLVNFIYHSNNTSCNFLTFGIFCPKGTSFAISNGGIKEIPIKFCDNQSDHNAIVLSLKKVFEHNPKHNKYKSSNYSYYEKVISSLACYNERIKDTTEAQNLLDTSIYYNGDFFNCDKNQNHVVFVHTLNNVFHGFNINLTEADSKIINRMLE